MNKSSKRKNVLSLIAWGIFALALFFNTSINYNNDSNEATFSLTSLQTAQAQEESGKCYETVCFTTVECVTLPNGTEDCFEDEECFEIEVDC